MGKKPTFIIYQSRNLGGILDWILSDQAKMNAHTQFWKSFQLRYGVIKSYPTDQDRRAANDTLSVGAKDAAIDRRVHSQVIGIHNQPFRLSHPRRNRDNSDGNKSTFRSIF